MNKEQIQAALIILKNSENEGFIALYNYVIALINENKKLNEALNKALKFITQYTGDCPAEIIKSYRCNPKECHLSDYDCWRKWAMRK